MKKILLCFGTRPEAIKMASLVHTLQDNKNLEVKVCVTAQHREMLDQVLDFFEITPDFDLDIMQPNQTLNSVSAKILSGMDTIFDTFEPDLILVHGDTTTSTLCALAAFHKGIKIGHVEAGLRTFDKKSPFPEEMNRVLTAQLSNFHFAPTAKSSKNLLQENIMQDNVVTTGNTVIDSLFWAEKKLAAGYKNETICQLEKMLDPSKKIILVTAHRRENFGQSIINICDAIIEIAARDNVEFFFPAHPNPNIKNIVSEKLSNISNVHLIEPLDYPAFIWLMKKSHIILTDSGGVQEEAPSFGIPVLVMRDNTERPEAVDAGTVKLIGTEKNSILSNVAELLDDNVKYELMSRSHNPYGDGLANQRIMKYIEEHGE